MKIVIALGGNALLKKEDLPSIKTQLNNANKAIETLKNIIEKNKTVITHGNGPQVGNILIRSELAKKESYQLPLATCVAQSEGELGYIIEQAILNNTKKPVVSTLTQVLVNKNDNAFKNPTKPIGPYYSFLEAKLKPYKTKNDSGKGYRRVVPSPKPIKIIETKAIQNLLNNNITIIASGGGGIPVIKEKNKIKEIDAVIDKDLASALLANEIKADLLIILTDVKEVYEKFNTKNQKPIRKIKKADIRKLSHHFKEGSMLPKIQAALNFKGKTIITNSANLSKALKGKAGTTIY